MSNVLVTEVVDDLKILPLNLQHHVLEIVRALSRPFKNEISEDNANMQLTNMENQQRETAGQRALKRAGTISAYDLELMSKAIEEDCGRVIIDESLYVQLDNAINVLESALQTFQTRKLEERHRRGYELHPVDPDEFNVWDSNIAWDDE